MNTTKERPILFSGPMVRAILEGRKTQTRRIVKPPGLHFEYVPDGVKGPYWRAGEWHRRNGVMTDISSGPWHGMNDNGTRQWVLSLCPYGQPGDRLIVKEHAWMWCEKIPNGTTKTGKPKFRYVPLRCAKVLYCSDHPEKPTIEVVSEYRGYEWGWRKKLGRFLPKWASRITLEITAVRVERLQGISYEDALAEGIDHYCPGITAALRGEVEADPIAEYRTLWESINGQGSWDANPWVWVISFKRITP